MDVASLIVATIAMLAACVAAYFAMKAPSKEDLARVEAHTAESAKQIAEQTKRELLFAFSRHASITVDGRSVLTEPMKVCFEVKDPRVSIIRTDLINHLENLSGTVNCSPRAPLQFEAEIPSRTVEIWFISGEVRQSYSNKHLQLRCHLLIDGMEAKRTFAVTLTQASTHAPNQPQDAKQMFMLVGSC